MLVRPDDASPLRVMQALDNVNSSHVEGNLMAEGPTETIARRVSELRELKGLTKEQLGERMAELGLPWNRFTVGGLEGGKRQNVSVVEWLALARALDVAPLGLLLPLGSADLIEILPDVAVHPDLARKWIIGEEQATNSERQTVGDGVFWRRQSEPLRLYAELNAAQEEMHRAESEMRTADRIGRSEQVAVAREGHVAALRRLAGVLDAMVSAEIAPPAFPGIWLDEMAELGMLQSADRVRRFEE